MTRNILSYLTALSLGLLVGCGSDEPQQGNNAPEQPAVSGAEVLKNPEYQREMGALKRASAVIAGQRMQLLKKMETMAAAKRSLMPSADEAKLRAELDKDPEWVSLVKRMDDLTEAYQDNQKARLATVRKYIAPEDQPVSK